MTTILPRRRLNSPCSLQVRRHHPLSKLSGVHRPLQQRTSARKAFHDAYVWFVSAFRQAAEKLRSGDRNAVFPAAGPALCGGIVLSPALFASLTHRGVTF